ncbi:MAG: response regulator [Bacillota bacterium]|nr:response regulator [Bacillota bacterium]
MVIKSLKIGTKLMIGFAVMMFFVIVLGMTAYLKTDQLHEQTEKMYQDPLQVRRAIGLLNTNILKMRIGIKDLMLATSDEEKNAALEIIALASGDAEKQLNIVKERYSGPSVDVEEAYQTYNKWKIARQENIKLALAGEIEKVKESSRSDGTVGLLREKMFDSLNKIDETASNNADALYISSVELKDTLKRQQLLLIVVLLLLSLILSYSLLRSIRKPLNEINDAVQRFHHGDLTARSNYDYKNEFGMLSSSFNEMANLIQVNTDLKEKLTSITEVMLSEYDANQFFRTTLGALTVHTNSQTGAVYLLSDDKKTFEHFESIGMDDNAKQSFAADSFEGEFGVALFARKLQHIKNIPEDTRFVFHTVNGKFIPREIITIPILSSNEVIAIISLASVSKFADQSIALIDNAIVSLGARIDGILAYRRIKEFKEVLEQQNRELDAHKSELSAQAAKLMTQNTELEIQKEQLNEASRLKTNFLSNMSHELRTPLNSVIALSGVLSRRLANQIPEEEYSFLEIIGRNGKNLLMLINDILDISRIEAGREEIEITKFNVNSLIAEVVTMIQPQADQKNIELLHEPSGSDLFIRSDADKCRHILQNIVGNALKFTEKGKVEITAQQSGNNIEIKVTDSGIGIAADHQQHIFDEFRQADGSTSRRFGGTGLGLAIAKKYSNLLGGTVSVKSTLNEGSEFTISLPLRYAVDERIAEAEKTTDSILEIKQPLIKPAFASLDKTILMVEDNESAIIQIKDLVEEMGYRVLVAHDASEAFGIIDQVIPDAMMLDLMIPGIDGFEVLQILRNAEPTANIPVLILTAKHITKEELKLLKRNNIHQLIQKGDVNRRELQKAITNMLFPMSVEEKEPHLKSPPIEVKPVVLVVEDNPDNMITVKALLAGHYTIIEAANGIEGIEMAKKYVPNLVLMDIALPGKDGLEAFKTIRALPKLQHIPIIALTSSAMTHERETILSHGFNAFIAKPIMEKQFFQVLSEVLHGQ